MSDTQRERIKRYDQKRRAEGLPIDRESDEFLRCLDTDTLIARHQWAVWSAQRRLDDTRDMHARQLRKATDITGKARAWWDHCVQLRREGRKMARLTDMGLDDA